MFWRFGAVSSPAEQWKTITSSLARPLSNQNHSHVHVTQKCKIFRGILYVIKTTSIPSYMKNVDGRTLGRDYWYLKIPVFIWHRQWKTQFDVIVLSVYLDFFHKIECMHACSTRISLLLKPLLKGRLAQLSRGNCWSTVY